MLSNQLDIWGLLDRAHDAAPDVVCLGEGTALLWQMFCNLLTASDVHQVSACGIKR